MPGILDNLLWYEWANMAAVVVVYCTFAYRLGRT